MKKVILLIMDGWGIAHKGPGNYIEMAKTPVYDSLIKHYPHAKNKASGEAVGLPKGIQGNSEVGHLHLGAGRIIWQQYQLINNSISDKSFYKNKVLVSTISESRRLHLIGMCSDEGVHSHINHLKALLEMAKKARKQEVYVHFIADGRDVAEFSAKKYAIIIDGWMKTFDIGLFGSIIGRYYAMDRDNNWNRTKMAYELYTEGKGHKENSILDAIESAYDRGDKTDYYIEPTLICEDALVREGDGIIFFNFRTDRPRQLCRAFTKPDFTEFKRKKRINCKFTTMTEYDKSLNCSYAFEEEKVANNLGKVLAEAGLKQLRLAETEKYAHVTYFFNSQDETPNRGEKRIMIPSPKVPSYDQKPEMSAKKIAAEAIKQIQKEKFDFILMNFANCDLVGHSAVKKAIIEAVEVVDSCVGKVIGAAKDHGYSTLVTADHGSAEEKLYLDGTAKPAHSSNPVPIILIDDYYKNHKLINGGQSDVAPTILKLMDLKKPIEMTGKSLIN